MTNTGFIEDGYAIVREIEEDPQGRYPSIVIQYRPLHQKELNEALDEMKKFRDRDEGSGAEGFADGLIAERVEMWTIKNQADEVVEITSENVAKLEPLLRMAIWRIVFSAEKDSTEKN